jgi:hypothetical protein
MAILALVCIGTLLVFRNVENELTYAVGDYNVRMNHLREKRMAMEAMKTKSERPGMRRIQGFSNELHGFANEIHGFSHEIQGGFGMNGLDMVSINIF